MNRIVVLDPREPRMESGTLSPRLDTLKGTTIGIIWNGRRPGPGDIILKSVGERLRDEYGVEKVVFRTKPYLGNIAPEELLAEMQAEADAVLAGVGD